MRACNTSGGLTCYTLHAFQSSHKQAQLGCASRGLFSRACVHSSKTQASIDNHTALHSTGSGSSNTILLAKLRIAADVAQGVAALHAAGIVHTE